MRVVVQRVKSSSVEIDDQVVSSIGQGFLVLLGVGPDDDQSDVDWLVNKVANLRVFSDDEGKMNLSVQDIEGEVLVVSQFTLFASTKKGTRPSFTKSAKPELAKKLYEEFTKKMEVKLSRVQCGVFAADMTVKLENWGPVTINIDSKNKE